MWLATLLLFPVLVWGVPGWLASRWLWPRSSPLERAASTLLLGPVLVVPVAYLPHYLLRATQGTGSVVIAAALVAAAFVLLSRWRPREAEPPRAAGATHGWIVVGGLALICAALAAATRHWGHAATDWFAPCAHKAALFLIEAGDGDGLRVWDPYWQRWVTHLVEHAPEPGFGLESVLVNHRVGSAAFFVHPLLYLGSAATIVTTFYEYLAVALLSGLLIGRQVRSAWLVLLLAGAFGLFVYDVATYMVNENVLGLICGLGVLYLLLRGDGGVAEACLAGACWALCVGVRPETAVYLPAVALLALPHRRAFVVLLVGLLLFYAPWALTNIEVYGNPLANPALGNAATPIELLGFEFVFHPLNFPVMDTVLRPSGAPFPVLFQMPLEHLQLLGAPLWLVAAAGAMSLRWRHRLVVLAWAAPIYGLLLLIVYLDHQKLSYALLCAAPLPWLLGAGAAALPAFSRNARIGLLAFGIVAFVLAPWVLSTVELEVDPRPQYGEEANRQRADLEAERASLTAPAILPRFRAMGAPALDTTGSMLTAAAPTPAPQGPTALPILWRLTSVTSHDREVALHEHPLIHPFIADPQSEPAWTTSFVTLSIAVRSDADTGRVIAHWTDAGLTVDIDAAAGDGLRYLWLGARDRLLGQARPVTVTAGGLAVDTLFYLLERPGAPAALRLVSNHAWHYRPDRAGLRLVPEPWPTAPCGVRTERGQTLGVAPGVYMTRRGRDPALRVRVAERWPPPPPDPGCAPVVLR